MYYIRVSLVAEVLSTMYNAPPSKEATNQRPKFKCSSQDEYLNIPLLHQNPKEIIINAKSAL